MSDLITEYCLHCDGEVEIEDNKVNNCPECKNEILPCSTCEYEKSGTRRCNWSEEERCWRFPKGKEGVGMAMFKGYCILKDGTTMPPVTLKYASEVWSYADLQKHLFHEVRICDADDFITLQVIDKKLVYPTEEEGIPKEFINRFNSNE